MAPPATPTYVLQIDSILSAPHTAILFTGNEHAVELNHIHDVCRFSSNTGAIYTGRDWSARGNKIRHNFVHDFRTSFASYGVHGIYLDDCVSDRKMQDCAVRR